MRRSRPGSKPTLLRARGGISHKFLAPTAPHRSSPRTRRYFRRLTSDIVRIKLFSAHAEVFPFTTRPTDYYATLLRARGGISWTH